MAAAKTTSAKKTTATPKKPAAKAPAKPAPKKYAARADLGSEHEVFFAKQPPTIKPITDALRKLIDGVVPKGTTKVIKWGMPFYALGDELLCAIGAHKAHVNFILPGDHADPDGLLRGEGKTGKHVRITSVDEIPRAQIERWVLENVPRR